ncbi:hypothetical protein [Chryseobacterium sp. MEBOG07]|uniref:hypothetical protein n=1 Tax=Chryseobacterium sp. MEBOG07 TaxID=2879939 RepID=UPI001F18335B|nr:hypothetical protein [Chryseobacterium sp. MEBOG07]UKB78307.1 hypothetical protein LF886_17745 [Chryseobacterium sp. MEBOG07]
MKKNELLKDLKFFLELHPTFEGSDEDIYSVRKDLKIKLWMDGGFIFDLYPLNFEINFNTIKTGILVIADRNNGSVLRILTKNIIGFELIKESDFKGNLNELFALKDNQKN